MVYDVFISHATPDKEAVARPLSEALQARGLSVWLDEEQLQIDDSAKLLLGLSLLRNYWLSRISSILL